MRELLGQQLHHAAIPDIQVAEGEGGSMNVVDNTTVPVKGNKEMGDKKTHPVFQHYNSHSSKTLEVEEGSYPPVKRY